MNTIITLIDSFERYLQDNGKGRGGDGGNYRRNAARELERFAEWTAGDRGGDDWTGIIPDNLGREPTFEDLDEHVFHECVRHLTCDREVKQNTAQTHSAIFLFGVAGTYLEVDHAQKTSAMTSLKTTVTNLPLAGLVAE